MWSLNGNRSGRGGRKRNPHRGTGVVDAPPRLVIAAVAIGMLVGVGLTQGPPDGKATEGSASSLLSSQEAAAREEPRHITKAFEADRHR